MNSIHNNGPDDKLLNDDKDHWLDFGWIHGLTTAVVVVLALSIILTQRQPTELDENGLLPTDVRQLGRSRSAEAEISGQIREQRLNEAEYKQEPGKDSINEFRKDMGQTMPAASAPQAGSRAEPMAAREVQDDLQSKKSLQSADTFLEEDLIQVNAPVEAVSAKPAVVEFADEVLPTEAGEVEIDSVKTDADKLKVERSQLSAEETQLQAILILKQAGDDRWEAELKKFIENHPDYPLPEELKN